MQTFHASLNNETQMMCNMKRGEKKFITQQKCREEKRNKSLYQIILIELSILTFQIITQTTKLSFILKETPPNPFHIIIIIMYKYMYTGYVVVCN